METLIYTFKSQRELIRVVKICLKNNISFEFMNNLEVYFFIYDDLDFEFKQAILGTDVINHKNKVQ